ncbi:MAG: hypothetical protein QOJ13_814 [Gaiellales bacterium]|nr:hypothetical protein [Gaiellales bacterium]
MVFITGFALLGVVLLYRHVPPPPEPALVSVARRLARRASAKAKSSEKEAVRAQGLAGRWNLDPAQITLARDATTKAGDFAREASSFAVAGQMAALEGNRSTSARRLREAADHARQAEWYANRFWLAVGDADLKRARTLAQDSVNEAKSAKSAASDAAQDLSN